MRSFVCLAMLVAGCGGSRFKTEKVGVVSVGNGSSITLARGNYQLAMTFDVPRAQLVEWSLHCPTIERTGVVGETFEDYRARRLAELRRMVEEDRRRLATATSAVAGSTTAHVHGSRTSVRTAVHVRPGVIAEEAIQDIHELQPGDVGRGSYTATIHLQTAQDGACTLSTKALDPVGGTMAVERVRDLRAEEQERIAARNEKAIDARVRVRSRLVAFGADEHARERRAAEERLRLETEARLTWEAEAPERERRARLEAERAAKEEEARRARLAIVERERIERLRIEHQERRARLLVIERQRREALRVRGAYIAWLVEMCNADPRRRERIAIERFELERRTEIERIERERRFEIERARVARAQREREQRELRLALSVRAQLTGYLLTAGARLRPPRPEMIVEVAGSAPFDGARWEAGAWIWVAESWQWQWRKGGWTDATQFGSTGGDVAVRARVPAPAPVTTTTATATATTTIESPTVVIPTGVTVEVPRGSITIDVAPSRPTRVKNPPRVRDHRRR